MLALRVLITHIFFIYFALFSYERNAIAFPHTSGFVERIIQMPVCVHFTSPHHLKSTNFHDHLLDEKLIYLVDTYAKQKPGPSSQRLCK